MASYIVLEPEGGTASGKAEQALLLRDGFSILAFIAPLIWFLLHRMWLEAFAVLSASVALAALGTVPGNATLSMLLSLLVSFFIGLEAQGLRIAALRRRGWSVWGVVEGVNRGEAELRYASEIESPAAQRPTTAPPSAPAAGRSKTSGSTAVGSPFGLLDYPRRS